MSLSVRKLVGVPTVLLVALVGFAVFWSVSAFATIGFASLTSFAPPGGFNGPFGLAVDNSADLAKGDVYITDQGNDAVDEFSAEGALLTQVSVPGVTLGQMTVDDYAGLVEGDVYVAGSSNGVIYRFSTGLGSKEELITGLEEPTDVAVDEAGDVFVSDGGETSGAGKVLEFNAAGEPIDPDGVVVGIGDNTVIDGIGGLLYGRGGLVGLAVNGSGAALYVTEGNGNGPTLKYTLSDGKYVADAQPFDNPGGLAGGVTVAPSGDVYIDRDFDQVGKRGIVEYEPSGALLTTFGHEILSYSTYGIGVNGESGDVYVADQEYSTVSVFEPGEIPQAPVTEPYSELHGSSVVLNGSLSGGETNYYFEYNIGSSCEGGQTTTPVAASGVQHVHAEITGLPRFTHYSFCLVSKNKYGSEVGSVLPLETGLVQPHIEAVSVFSTGVETATVGAQVNPEGGSTTYYVEYGLNVPYESKTAQFKLGAVVSPVAVAVPVTGLTPGTQYHYRFVAVNEVGLTQSVDAIFTTYPAHGSALPDGRVYEMVSPPENRDADVYSPQGNEEMLSTYYPFRAAADGRAVGYAGAPTVGGNGIGGVGLGNEYRAVRNPQGGWSQSNITPGGDSGVYQSFSSDLSVGFLTGSAEPPFVATEDLGRGKNSYGGLLYGRNFDETDYRPVSSVTPPFRSTREFGVYGVAETMHMGLGESLVYAGSSADLGDTLFEANDDLLEGKGKLEQELSSTVEAEALKHKVGVRLTEESNALLQEEEALKLEGQSEKEAEKHAEYEKKQQELNAYESVNNRLDDHNELYVSSGTGLNLVNVLPEGVLSSGATFGGAPSGEVERLQPGFSNAISADGSRIFWTSVTTVGTTTIVSRPKAVYVREDGTKTVQVSAGPATFWTASENGKYAFYTEEGKLWRFDVENETRTELAGSGGGVLGVVGTNETGEEGAYVYFVSNEALPGLENSAGRQPAEEDNLYVYEPDPEHAGQSRIAFIGTLSEEDSRDWALGSGERTAEPTPDGQGLVFASHANMTNGSYPGEGSEEVYVYSTQDSSLFCASCRPQGSGGHLTPSSTLTYMYRWISEDGDRVFFDSNARLVPQDISGKENVYEWERDGSGECTEQDGCVYILSGGVEYTSAFVDASASGNDAFFVTREKLVPEDQNENVDLYDARVDGALPVSPPECFGTGCQGAPASAPVFATPASVTFNGVGNFPPPAPISVSATKKVKPLTRAQKLSKALKVCRKKRKGKARTVCETRARKQYAAKAKVVKSPKRRAK